MPYRPFRHIDTPTLDRIAGILRAFYHSTNRSERVWRKYVQVRAALDARHRLRLASLAMRSGIPVTSGVRAGSLLFAEPTFGHVTLNH